MKATFIRQYRKRETGNMVFVYALSGTPEQIVAHKKFKGKFSIVDEKTKEVLIFENRFHGPNCELVANEKNEWRVDTTKADQLKSLVDQYGIDIALTMIKSTEA